MWNQYWSCHVDGSGLFSYPNEEQNMEVQISEMIGLDQGGFTYYQDVVNTSKSE